MFLPDVTNIRSPTTFAPVVSPTSCLIEPRYSTLGDITASGRVAAEAVAGVIAQSSDSPARAHESLILGARTRSKMRTCGDRVARLRGQRAQPAHREGQPGQVGIALPAQRAEQRL